MVFMSCAFLAIDILAQFSVHIGTRREVKTKHLPHPGFLICKQSIDVKNVGIPILKFVPFPRKNSVDAHECPFIGIIL